MTKFDQALAAIKSRDLESLKIIFDDYSGSITHELKTRDKDKKYPADDEGRTLLYLAVGDKFEGLEGEAKQKAEQQNLEIIKFLIEKNPSAVNQARNGNKASPLFLATQNNRNEVVEVLVRAGANIDHKTEVKYTETKTNQRSIVKKTALELAQERNYQNIKNTITDLTNYQPTILGNNIFFDDESTQTNNLYRHTNLSNEIIENPEELAALIISAISINHFPFVQYMVDRGANVNLVLSIENRKSKTTMHMTLASYAAQNHELEFLQCCQEQGIDPRLVLEKTGQILSSPIALKINLNSLKFLLSTKKFDPNFPPNSLTPLMRAASFVGDEYIEAMRLLIENGANIDQIFNSSNSNEITALSVAATQSNMAGVKFLLEKKGGVKTQVALSSFAFHFIAGTKFSQKTPEIFSLVLKDAIQNGVISGINDLIWVSDGSNLKLTFLHIAAHSNNIQLVKMLLEMGADLRVKNNFMVKPADLIKIKSSEALRYLENYEKFLNIRDRLPEEIRNKVIIKNSGEENFFIELTNDGRISTINCNESESKIVRDINEAYEKLLKPSQPQTKNQKTSPKPETAEESKTKLTKEDEEEAEKKYIITKIEQTIGEIEKLLPQDTATQTDFEKLKSNIFEAFKTPTSLTSQKNNLFGQWTQLQNNILDLQGWAQFDKQLFAFLNKIEMAAINAKPGYETDQTLDNIKLMTDLKSAFKEMHLYLFNQIRDTNLENLSLTELQNYKLILEYINALQQDQKPNKRIAKVQAALQLTKVFLSEELKGDEDLLRKAIDNLSVKDLAKIFEPNNLENYTPQDLEKLSSYFRQKITKNPDCKKMIEIIARNLVANKNIAAAALKTTTLIDSLNVDQKYQLQDQLYQKFDQSNNGDLQKTASFLVAVEKLIFKTEDAPQSQEDVTLLVANELSGLEIKMAQPENWQDKVEINTTIQNALEEVLRKQQYSVILLCTPHGRQAENPHLETNAQELITKNLAVGKSELEEKLGKDSLKDVKDEDLQKITEALAKVCHLKKRGSGSHNAIMILPKIFPNKTSPITTDEERKSYIANINKLCQAAASQEILIS